VNNKTLIAALVSMMAASCGSNTIKHDSDTAVTDEMSKSMAVKKQVTDNKGYSVLDAPYVAARPVKPQELGMQWLASRTISLQKSSAPIPLSAVMAAINQTGINIYTSLPADSYIYSGYSIASGTNAESALNILTEQMGLDYEVHARPGQTPYISIVEMKTDSYRLNVPDVIAAMSIISGSSGAGQSGSTGGSSPAQGGGAMGSQSQSGGQGGGQSGGQGSSSLYFESSFWTKLQTELESMMTVLVPQKQASAQNNSVSGAQVTSDRYAPPNLPYSQPVQMLPPVTMTVTQGGSQDLYQSAVVGRVVVNSATGNVSITAPSHVRRRIMSYLKELDDELNTRVQIEARIVSVTRSLEQTRGLDIAAFKEFASGKWGLSVTNNVLGNITISDPVAGAAGAVADNALNQSLFGVSKADKAFQAFFAYLSNAGTTQSVSDLRGSSSSGRTINISSRVNDPSLRSSTSTITTETGTSSGGSSSEIEDNWTGTTAKITPQYDPRRDVVHNLLDIELILDAGTKVESEPIVAGSNIQFREVDLKRVAVVNLQTQTVSRAGEVVLVGGIRTMQQVDGKSGVTGLQDSKFGDVFGRSNQNVVVTDYFILLSVSAFNYRE
jgi:hypothetical protein